MASLYAQGNRVLRTCLPLEKDAARLYTRAVFDRFSNELFLSGRYEVEHHMDDGYYNVKLIIADDDDSVMTHSYTVGSSPNRREFFCQCKKYEHSGIPCRHIIKVRCPYLTYYSMHCSA